MTLALSTAIEPWTAARLRRLAGTAFHSTPVVDDGIGTGGLGPSDFDLDPDLAGELAPRHPRPAAVLVPIVDREQPTMLLTVRTDSLPSHAGQISFPGGKIDEGDAGPLETALREAEEEIGLSRTAVEPLGYLDIYRTGTGYAIQPVVALVAPGHTLTINPSEVADVFEVPLAFLMEAGNHQRHARAWQGRQRHFYAMPYGERFIWGATAGIIRNLHKRLHTP